MPPKKKAGKKEEVQIPEGDANAGKTVFEVNCTSCHALSGDASSAAAPNLGGVVNRKAGTTEFPGYSAAMTKSGITWTVQNLYAFIKNPKNLVKGNLMSFAGVPSDQERADLIAYLSTTKGSD